MRELAICCAQASPTEAEKALQAALGCKLLPTVDEECQFYLRFEADGLTLYQNQADAPGGLLVDFASSEIQRRRTGLRNQGLGKAMGLKKFPSPRVLDATAGLGRDACLLAAAGCHVLMMEKSPVVGALLRDGLARAEAIGGELAEAVSRMQLQEVDFLAAAQTTAPVDVVYLDPMFPHGGKRGKSKKAMYLLQELLGEEEEDPRFLSSARALAKRRVVVKRARNSPLLAGEEPDISFKGSSNRYDVYLSANQ